MSSTFVRFAAASAALSALALSASATGGVTLGCSTGGSGGAFPTSGTGGGGVFPTTFPPFDLATTLNVLSIPSGSTCVTEVRIHSLSHTFCADVQIVLEDPAGGKHNIFVQQGGGCDFVGDYTFTGLNGSGPFPACVGTTIAPGTYDQNFGTWPSGTQGVDNADLSSVAPQLGTWTLRFYDWAGADTGSLVSWDLCFGTPPPPPPPPPTPCNGPALTTLFAQNNNGSQGGQIFFDLSVTNASGIDVSQVDFNSIQLAGTNTTLSLYTIPTTSVGQETNVGAWTLRSSGPAVLAGTNIPTVAELTDFHLAPGSYGIALVLSASAGFAYTNGTGANQVYSNADMTITCGKAQNVPWTAPQFSPRVFNGSIRYNCITGPVAYCTAGTSTNGCNASISANNNPSVSQANSCNITIASVEGQKSGLVFYGINNSGFTPSPWGSGSTSFLCVKPPTQRTTTQSSGGTVGLCDGQLTLDWNAYQLANPASLGNPWAAGNKVNVQGWYRDPPAPKTTQLSNAIEMTYLP